MTPVKQFHQAYGLPAPSSIDLEPDLPMLQLRLRLIMEEAAEVQEELKIMIGHAVSGRRAPVEERIDVTRRLLKELCDLRYVVDGAAVSLGLPIDAAFAEVHASNMSKLGEDHKPIYDAGGKVLKGPNYRQADMTPFVPDIVDITSE